MKYATDDISRIRTNKRYLGHMIYTDRTQNITIK